MADGVASDRIDRNSVPLVEFGIVHSEGTNDIAVAGPRGEHVIHLFAHLLVSAHPAPRLQMDPVDARGQLDRIRDLTDDVGYRLGQRHDSFPKPGIRARVCIASNLAAGDGAHGHVGGGQPADVVEVAGDAEVGQQDSTRTRVRDGEQDVGRFDVAVQQAAQTASAITLLTP
jgi:hypothetical protein